MKKEKLTFEESILRLEQIVQSIEQGDITLDDSLKLFQEGTYLIQSCTKLLDDAQLQIKKIVPGADGAPVEEDVDIEL